MLKHVMNWLISTVCWIRNTIDIPAMGSLSPSQDARPSEPRHNTHTPPPGTPPLALTNLLCYLTLLTSLLLTQTQHQGPQILLDKDGFNVHISVSVSTSGLKALVIVETDGTQEKK